MVYFEKSQPAPTIGNTHNSQEILDRLIDYYENEDNEYFLIKIKEHLSNRFAFIAFKRWIIRDNQALHNEFKQYIGD